MMRNQCSTARTAVISVVVFCISPGLSAAASLPRCPASIPETSIKLEPIPAGWTSYIASPLYLNSAAPVDGPPQRRGELVPTAERKAKGQTIFAYQLDGTFPEGKWLQCSYGEYGQVALSKRMDDGIRRCEVSYKKGSKAGQNEIGIDCR